MPSRREFLQAGIAASVLPLVAGRQADQQVRPSTPFYAVIFDRRFAGARAFAAAAHGLGATATPIEGDITSLWYRDLSARLKSSPVALAGVTLNGTLFCLDDLVRRYGMRVVFREEQKNGGAGTVDQEFWGSEAAAVVTQVVARAREVTPPALVVTHLTRSQDDGDPLVSWVIVPAGARMVSPSRV